MNNVKKLLSLVLVIAMVMSMAACQQNTTGSSDPSDSGNVSGSNATYTVTVRTAGKMPLEGIEVQIHRDGELMNVMETNADGKAVMEMPASDDYNITILNVPSGYKYNDSYQFAGGTCLIELVSAPIEGASMENVRPQLGDVIADFEITDAVTQETYKVSDILKEKKMLLLNVFYTSCSPCNTEMPYMQRAYEMYEEDVAIFAVSPYGADNLPMVANFKNTHELTFPVAKVPTTWGMLALKDGTTNETAYPTTYVIDRYGVICLIEQGGLTSLRPFVGMMDYFTADDYTQKLCYNGLDDIISQVKPTVEPMADEEVAEVLGNADGNIQYSSTIYKNGEVDAYNWPFIQTEKNGVNCLMSSNAGYDVSYSVLTMDVTLKAGQAIGFDYLVSSEVGADLVHIIVDDVPINTISGTDAVEQWKSCYAWAALVDGTYKVTISYIKDDGGPLPDEDDEDAIPCYDAVYLKNFRIIDAKDIDTETYLPVEAATSSDGIDFEYVDIILGDDGYYHVGTKNGPLLLANLLGSSQFDREQSLYVMALNGTFVSNGYDYQMDMLPYASYASNSKMTNYCTVTEELAQILRDCIKMIGYAETEEEQDKEWLKVCKYYASYGTNGEQMMDPIEGLATFSAFTAKVGKNEIPYLEGIPIMPRGKLAKFVPQKSGVYRVTSHVEKPDGEMHSWIFGDKYDHLTGYVMVEGSDEPLHVSEDRTNIIAESVRDGRFMEDTDNTEMTCYLEAGRTYYVNIAFWDPYTVGTVPYTIEYLGRSYEQLRMCSPGPFTFRMDESGSEAVYETIHGGIDAVLGKDGYYYKADENGEPMYDSKIYVDLTGYALFNMPIAGEGGMLERGAFNFTQDENDLYILQLIEKYDGDREKVEEYLKSEWGADMWPAKVEEYHLDDVFDGIFHGKGNDETAVMQSYVNKMIAKGELQGCIAVDEELARILQLLMDKYTFENVEESWLKLCYYYDHMGA